MPVDQKFEADGKTINKVKALEMMEKYNTPEKLDILRESRWISV